MKAQFLALLTEWCDALLALQWRDNSNPDRDGAILCPACSIVHGRGHDVIYPLLYLYDATGQARYLEGAKALFNWGEKYFCDDGSYYNDGQSQWNGITVFYAVSLCEALDRHGHVLDEETRQHWEKRLLEMGEWLLSTMTLEFNAVINYYATCAAAMALLGNHFDREDFRAHAREMARICMGYLTENGFLRGEGKPIDTVTARDCYPIDIGYNVEESMPSLVQYAVALGDQPVYEILRDRFAKLLDLMLPDGGWDNSFGSRNYKWTYWGSRTSDGCQGVFTLLARDMPVFREAALRNLECYAASTQDGLLHGGPHYHRHGERACTHHSLCHAKALALALDEGVVDGPRMALPSDNPAPIAYYPEMETVRGSVGDMRATFTSYDFYLHLGTHATGGTLTLLWHKAWGPLIASSTTDYTLLEAHNMQLSRRKSQHRSLTPRLVLGKLSNAYDRKGFAAADGTKDHFLVETTAHLTDVQGNLPPRPTLVRMGYLMKGDSLEVYGEIFGEEREKCRFLLPIVCPHDAHWEVDEETAYMDGPDAQVSLEVSDWAGEPQPIFFLNGGFEALEFAIAPDPEGHFRFNLKVIPK